MATNITFTVEDLRTPEGTELVLQQFRTALNRIPEPAQLQPQKGFSLSDLSPEDIAELAKLIRDQLQAPGAAPLNLQDLPGAPASSQTITGSLLNFVVGTLSPDTRPFLTILNAYQVLFYSTDFDHLYLWVGLSWLAVERTSAMIVWFSQGPATAGWHICDGSAVTRTDGAGGVFGATVPDLITGNPYVRGGSVYSGPSATAAIAPTISGITGSENAIHQHHVTATGSLSFSGTIPAYAYGFSTSSGTTVTSSSLDSGTVTGLVNQVGEDCSNVIPGEVSFVSVVNCGAAYELSSASVSDTHVTIAFEGTAFLIDETPFNFADYLGGTFTGDDVLSGNENAAHQHSGTSLTVSATGEPTHMTLIPYFRL